MKFRFSGSSIWRAPTLASKYSSNESSSRAATSSDRTGVNLSGAESTRPQGVPLGRSSAGPNVVRLLVVLPKRLQELRYALAFVFYENVRAIIYYDILYVNYRYQSQLCNDSPDYRSVDSNFCILKALPACNEA